MKKFITVVVSFFIGCMAAFALENDSHVEYQYIDNIYSNRQIGENFYTGPQGFVYVNGKIAYCIDPTLILRNETYTSSEDFSIVNINQNMLDYLELVSHFGYGYSERVDANYYLATQEIIWEYITGGEIYWTNGKGGEIINIDTYKNDILNSVSNYLLTPDIPSYIETYQGEDVILEDKNSVLKYYEPDSWIGEIINDTLKLDATYKGTCILTLIRKPLNYETSYVYLSEGSQTLATFGYGGNQNDNVDIMFKVKILSKLTLVKKDALTSTIIKNKETQVKIYDVLREEYILENGSDIFTIGKTGTLETETYLEEGTYRIEEVVAPAGYKKLTEPLTFYVRIYDSSTKEISIFNEPIRYSIKITKNGEKYIGLKEDENGISGQYIEEHMNNVVYGVYARENIFDTNGDILYEKNSLVTKINIQNGFGSVNNLIYGRYYIKELECPNNYLLDKTITEIDFTGESNNISLSFLNTMRKGNITIRKLDNQIGLKGAEFNLKGELYPYNINLKSDNFGYIIVKNLPYDTYYLEEIKPPLGYVLDNEIKTLNLNSSNLQYDFLNVKEKIDTIPEIEETPEEPLPEEEITEMPEKPLPEEEIPEIPEEPASEEEVPEIKEEKNNFNNSSEEIIQEKNEKDDSYEYIGEVVENPNTSVTTGSNIFINILFYIIVLLGIQKLKSKS